MIMNDMKNTNAIIYDYQFMSLLPDAHLYVYFRATVSDSFFSLFFSSRGNFS